MADKSGNNIRIMSSVLKTSVYVNHRRMQYNSASWSVHVSTLTDLAGIGNSHNCLRTCGYVLLLSTLTRLSHRSIGTLLAVWKRKPDVIGARPSSWVDASSRWRLGISARLRQAEATISPLSPAFVLSVSQAGPDHTRLPNNSTCIEPSN